MGMVGIQGQLEIKIQLWEQSLFQQLDPAVNYRMAVHLGLRNLGLDIGSNQLISMI
jgi:hypothetical protein